MDIFLLLFFYRILSILPKTQFFLKNFCISNTVVLIISMSYLGEAEQQDPSNSSLDGKSDILSTHLNATATTAKAETRLTEKDI